MRSMNAHKVAPDARYVLLRHDIDTDPVGGRLMHEIEHSLGVVGTYYFRLKTLDLSLSCGSCSVEGMRLGYHFETGNARQASRPWPVDCLGDASTPMPAKRLWRTSLDSERTPASPSSRPRPPETS